MQVGVQVYHWDAEQEVNKGVSLFNHVKSWAVVEQHSRVTILLWEDDVNGSGDGILSAPVTPASQMCVHWNMSHGNNVEAF